MATTTKRGDPPILPFGIAMLGTALGANSIQEPGLIDPRQFRDQLVYGDTDIAQDLSMLGRRYSSGANKAIGDIKSLGAAGRLPEGAVLTGIGEAQGQAGRGAASALPALRREGRQSTANYLGMVNQYETAKAGYAQAGVDRGLEGLGALGRIALLWQGGLL